ncbi:RNase J family beta-CASP ribonuclease [Candidatus Woesearchaeota archaeon]|nr:RNase J family beta-CASP ribonuclease [Candidatus Woesearchaeota archaeon]
MIEIAPVGGYSEVGKNMTAIKVDDEVVILDVGLYLPAIVGFEEEQGLLSSDELIKIGAIPDDNKIKEWWPKIKAILISHCHLDHLGAVPYLCNKYKSPIIGTQYTIEVLKKIINDNNTKIKNKLKPIEFNKRFKISENISCELINVTHSTLQTAIIVLHTKYGTIVYANDFKIDENPVLGEKTNIKALKNLKNVKMLILDSLYSKFRQKTPSENVARQMLKEALLNEEHKGRAIIVTTFSSHIARLHSISEFGKRLNRKVVFLGRSLGKYISSAQNLDLINFGKNVEIVTWPKQIEKKLKEIEKNDRGKYLIICTGNQGEPKSVLSKLINKTFHFEFLPNDLVVFSCNVIPTKINIHNREVMEQKLKNYKVTILKGIHQSGHACGEDMKNLIKLLKPEHIIPTHGDHDKLIHLSKIAVDELNYEFGKTVHLLNNGDKLQIK